MELGRAHGERDMSGVSIEVKVTDSISGQHYDKRMLQLMNKGAGFMHLACADDDQSTEYSRSEAG